MNETIKSYWRHQVSIFWNLMGAAADFQLIIPEYDKLIVCDDKLTRCSVLVPKDLLPTYRTTVGSFIEGLWSVDIEEVYLKGYYWQWHDAKEIWRIFSVRWGFGPRSKTLVYNNAYELRREDWPIIF